jgi:hypothetical protein
MVGKVEFRPEDYGPDIARILDLAGGGKRPMPLVKRESVSSDACNSIENLPLQMSVRSGLYLYCGCWDSGHTAADSVESPDGYFWHGIAHRQEPDPGNAVYWFHKTGRHPIFPKLAAEAAPSGYPVSSEWDPFAFIDYCESARRRPGSPDEQIAIAVQLLEWQLLFDYCARGKNI